MDMQNPRTIHFVDIETTTLEPEQGEIIDICIISSEDWGRTICNIYSTKVKPVHIWTADPAALNVNGYTESEWADAPVWSDVVDEISQILADGIICAHNSRFEAKWLSYHCTDVLTHRFMCTQTLAYVFLPLRSASMSALRKFFDWSDENAHTAAADAYDCYRFFKVCIVDPLPEVPD